VDAPLRSYYRGREVLVTGAAGFLGSHLVRRLAGLGAWVAALHRPGADLDRLAGAGPRVRRVAADLLDTRALKAWTRTHAPRTVFHLAAYGVDPRRDDPSLAFGVNVRGFVSLIESLDRGTLDAFVNTGTCFEYGRSARPISETDPLEPRGAYSQSKAAQVAVGTMLARTQGWPIVTLRPFTLYGPGEQPNRLIPQLLRGVLDGGEVRLTGGIQTRDFIYVDDAVDAFLVAGRTPAVAGEVFNIGSGRATSVRAVAERIRDLSGSSVVLKFGALPYRPDELWHLCADIGQARRRLGWSPRVELDEGLRRTLEWQRARRP
jgi:nucleoside-diphosphate-sugar epimerase